MFADLWASEVTSFPPIEYPGNVVSAGYRHGREVEVVAKKVCEISVVVTNVSFEETAPISGVIELNNSVTKGTVEVYPSWG